MAATWSSSQIQWWWRLLDDLPGSTSLRLSDALLTLVPLTQTSWVVITFPVSHPSLPHQGHIATTFRLTHVLLSYLVLGLLPPISHSFHYRIPKDFHTIYKLAFIVFYITTILVISTPSCLSKHEMLLVWLLSHLGWHSHSPPHPRSVIFQISPTWLNFWALHSSSLPLSPA